MNSVSVNPMLLSDEEFELWRTKSDLTADVAAFALLKFLDEREIYTILATFQKNNEPIVLNRNIVQAKFTQTEQDVQGVIYMAEKTFKSYFDDLTFFQWTTEEKTILNKASEFFRLHMTECTLALALRSLLKQYAAFRSTNVLVKTTLIKKYPHRRIISTMQFVMDVMGENAFEPEGYGIRAIQKLRLVHALIRVRIGFEMKDTYEDRADFTEEDYRKMLEDQRKNQVGAERQIRIWDTEWGEPINQQDMLFAVHTFSIEVLKGLIASGEDVSQEEIDTYYKAWHLIGRALGLDDALNPSDYAIGVQVQDRIYAKEFITDNPNAPILAEPLIQFLDDVLPLANRPGILGLVKLFNDPKDHGPVFKDILKLEMDEASNYYTRYYKMADGLGHFYMNLKYFFLPKSRKNLYFRDIANKQHKLFESVIAVEKTWSGDHFRISDGFGEQAAKSDEEELKKLPPRWKRLAVRFLPAKWLTFLGLTPKSPGAQ